MLLIFVLSIPLFISPIKMHTGEVIMTLDVCSSQAHGSIDEMCMTVEPVFDMLSAETIGFLLEKPSESYHFIVQSALDKPPTV
ncbi:MAG: hypothetical protein HY805_04685 [Nitrospirae bacterium]|nr:hypothetical protein [Nitrospirota bacterium]